MRTKIIQAGPLVSGLPPTTVMHRKAPRWKRIVRKAGKGTKKKVSLAGILANRWLSRRIYFFRD